MIIDSLKELIKPIALKRWIRDAKGSLKIEELISTKNKKEIIDVLKNDIKQYTCYQDELLDKIFKKGKTKLLGYTVVDRIKQQKFIEPVTIADEVLNEKT